MKVQGDPDSPLFLSAGVDTNGDALPPNFESLPYGSDTTYGGDGFPTEKVETRTDGATVYTRTWTYTPNATAGMPPNKTNAGWVRSV